METKLSFIVPVYNKDSIIEKTIKSLLDQSLKEFEIIFVLDGAQDTAKNLIHKLLKKRGGHKVIEIEHGGACRARNEGFKHSTGKYVVFWDADCVIEPHTAKAWCDILDEQPGIGFVYAGYKFLNEQGAINSEPFDPWLLRVNNYISTCFPLRREIFPGWDESLKSLQDWDFWLTIVEKGHIGKFMPGYAWSTSLPDKDSISGQGCTDEAWLSRVDPVKQKHNIADCDICVSSIESKHDGVALAKYIGADYRDIPNFKPNRYKTIIQVGFSLNPNRVETHANIFNDPTQKHVIFWTPENIYEIYNRISLSAIQKYSVLLNGCSQQFVESKTAKDLLVKGGFNVQIMPMPMENTREVKPLPDKPKFAVDIEPSYGEVFRLIDKSLPDIDMELMSGNRPIDDYSGVIHFFLDRTLSSTIKRAHMTGRHVISNVQEPYCGHVDDKVVPEAFIKELVNKIRETAGKHINPSAAAYYKSVLSKERLMEAIS